MRMRSLRWNLVVWEPSAGPADPFGAPGFTYLARAVGARWRPIFLVTGGLLLGSGVLLPSTIAFVSGMLVLGLSAPDARARVGLLSPTTAMVRGWSQRHQ